MWLLYIFLLSYRCFTDKVDPTQLTNMHWKFRFMQDTFVFYQLLGNDLSALELRFTEPPVSLLKLNWVFWPEFYYERKKRKRNCSLLGTFTFLRLVLFLTCAKVTTCYWTQMNFNPLLRSQFVITILSLNFRPFCLSYTSNLYQRFCGIHYFCCCC